MKRVIVLGLWAAGLLAFSLALNESLGVVAALAALGLVGYDTYMAFFYGQDRAEEQSRG